MYGISLSEKKKESTLIQIKSPIKSKAKPKQSIIQKSNIISISYKSKYIQGYNLRFQYNFRYDN